MSNVRRKVNKSSAKKPKTDEIKMQSYKARVNKTIIKPPKTNAKRSPKKTDKKVVINKDDKVKKFYNLKIIQFKSNKFFNNKKFIISSIVLFIIATILILSFSTPTGIPETISNSLVSLSSGSDFPVYPIGGKIITSKSLSTNIFTLTDTNFLGYSKNGGEIINIQHGFDNPSVSFSPARNLIYNNKNKKYIITNFSSTLYSGELENEILLGTISRSGHYAFATKSTGFETQVEVYNKNYKLKYKWFSANEPVSNILLSNNGKRLAVVTSSATNGEIKSTLYLLKYNSADPYFKYELSDYVYELKSYQNGFVAILSDKAIYYSWNSGEKLSKTFEDEKISFFKMNPDGDNIIVTNNGIITNRYKLYYFKKNKEIFSFEFNGFITDLSINDKKIYLLSNKKIIVLNKTGNQINLFELDNIVNYINLYNSKLIYINNESTISKLS